MVQADLWEETELNLEGWGIVRHGTKRDENYLGRENKNSNNIKKSYCFLESLWKYKQYKVGEWREEKLRGWWRLSDRSLYIQLRRLCFPLRPKRVFIGKWDSQVVDRLSLAVLERWIWVQRTVTEVRKSLETIDDAIKLALGSNTGVCSDSVSSIFKS